MAGSRKDVVYFASMDEADVLRALQNIDKQIDNSAKNATRSFGQGGMAATEMGTKIGLISGVVQSVTNELIQMGQAAVRQFGDIVAEAVKVASGFETTEKAFTSIFRGNEQAAVQTLERIRQKSLELGFDLREIARAFLPFVGSVEEFEQVAELATALARFQPEQGVIGARIALQEALSGQLRPLRERFEIPISATQRIKELQEELGEARGLYVGLSEELERMGRSIGALQDTFEVAVNQMRVQFQQFAEDMGAPIVDSLREGIQALLVTIKENEDTLEFMASAIGNIISQVADLTFEGITKFIESLDEEKIKAFALEVKGLISFMEVLVDSTGEGQTKIMGFGQSVENVNSQLGPWKQLLAEILMIVGQLSGGLNSLNITASGAGEVLNKLVTEGPAAAAEARQRIMRESEAAWKQGLADAEAAIDKLNGKLEENEDQIDAVADAAKKATSTSTALANAELGLSRAEQHLADAMAERIEAEEELAKKTVEEEEAAADKREDAATKMARALIDLEIETTEKRLDAIRKYNHKVDDLHRDAHDDRIDSRTDLERDIEDIMRDHDRDVISMEQEQAQKLLEIEEEYLERLQEIRRRFDFQAEEAVRQQDAVALMRIRRQMQFELNEARIGRDEQIDQEKDQGDEKRAELSRQLEQELEDANIAHERRLEDRQTQLQRELEAAKLALDREFEQIQINEDRKREAIARAHERTLEDIEVYLARRLRTLQRALDAMVAAELAAQAAMTAAAVAGANARAAARAGDRMIERNTGAGRFAGIGGSRPVYDSPDFESTGGIGGLSQPTHDDPDFESTGSFGGAGVGAFKRRQIGGRLTSGLPALVGEPLPGNRPNPEVYWPDNGYMVPWPEFQRVMSRLGGMGAGGGVTNVDNAMNVNAEINLSELGSASVVMRRIIQNEVTSQLVNATKAARRTRR